MKCPKCEKNGEETEMNYDKQNNLYYCWKCYNQIKLNNNTTLFN